VPAFPAAFPIDIGQEAIISFGDFFFSKYTCPHLSAFVQPYSDFMDLKWLFPVKFV
jgi:hypothetical protein